MKMFLILASILLLSIIGVQESFADSSDKVCDDKLCQDPPPRACTEDDHKKPLIPPLTRGLKEPYPRVDG